MNVTVNNLGIRFTAQLTPIRADLITGHHNRLAC